MSRAAFLATALLLMVATTAAADAPEPRRSIDLDRFMGRWHEILRTPNDFSIVQSCHRGSRDGRVTTFNTRARVTDTSTNAKFEASFFGGLIRQRYWVIDVAPDYSWMIATTADGRFPALLSRSPTMSAAQQTQLRGRIAELGLPTSGLIQR